MTTFTIKPTIADAYSQESCQLGTGAGQFSSKDVGKAVKLGAADAYVAAAAGDEIEGVISSVESYTVNQGKSFGGIQRGGRLAVTFEGTTVPVGGLVVMGTPVALGTELTVPVAVKTGVPTKFLWRMVSGTGVAATQGVIERI
jgi:hypothetical protein